MNSIKPFAPYKGIKPVVRNIATLDDTSSNYSFERSEDFTFKKDFSAMGEFLVMLIEALRQLRVQSGSSISVTNSTTVVRNNICNIINNYRSAVSAEMPVQLQMTLDSVSSTLSSGGEISSEQLEELIGSLSERLEKVSSRTVQLHSAKVTDIRSFFHNSDNTDIGRVAAELKKNFDLTSELFFNSSSFGANLEQLRLYSQLNESRRELVLRESETERSAAFESFAEAYSLFCREHSFERKSASQHFETHEEIRENYSTDEFAPKTSFSFSDKAHLLKSVDVRSESRFRSFAEKAFREFSESYSVEPISPERKQSFEDSFAYREEKSAFRTEDFHYSDIVRESRKTAEIERLLLSLSDSFEGNTPAFPHSKADAESAEHSTNSKNEAGITTNLLSADSPLWGTQRPSVNSLRERLIFVGRGSFAFDRSNTPHSRKSASLPETQRNSPAVDRAYTHSESLALNLFAEFSREFLGGKLSEFGGRAALETDREPSSVHSVDLTATRNLLALSEIVYRDDVSVFNADELREWTNLELIEYSRAFAESLRLWTENLPEEPQTTVSVNSTENSVMERINSERAFFEKELFGSLTEVQSAEQSRFTRLVSSVFSAELSREKYLSERRSITEVSRISLSGNTDLTGAEREIVLSENREVNSDIRSETNILRGSKNQTISEHATAESTFLGSVHSNGFEIERVGGKDSGKISVVSGNNSEVGKSLSEVLRTINLSGSFPLQAPKSAFGNAPEKDSEKPAETSSEPNPPLSARYLFADVKRYFSRPARESLVIEHSKMLLEKSRVSILHNNTFAKSELFRSVFPAGKESVLSGGESVGAVHYSERDSVETLFSEPIYYNLLGGVQNEIRSAAESYYGQTFSEVSPQAKRRIADPLQKSNQPIVRLSEQLNQLLSKKVSSDTLNSRSEQTFISAADFEFDKTVHNSPETSFSAYSQSKSELFSAALGDSISAFATHNKINQSLLNELVLANFGEGKERPLSSAAEKTRFLEREFALFQSLKRETVIAALTGNTVGETKNAFAANRAAQPSSEASVVPKKDAHSGSADSRAQFIHSDRYEHIRLSGEAVQSRRGAVVNKGDFSAPRFIHNSEFKQNAAFQTIHNAPAKSFFDSVLNSAVIQSKPLETARSRQAVNRSFGTLVFRGGNNAERVFEVLRVFAERELSNTLEKNIETLTRHDRTASVKLHPADNVLLKSGSTAVEERSALHVQNVKPLHQSSSAAAFYLSVLKNQLAYTTTNKGGDTAYSADENNEQSVSLELSFQNSQRSFSDNSAELIYYSDSSAKAAFGEQVVEYQPHVSSSVNSVYSYGDRKTIQRSMINRISETVKSSVFLQSVAERVTNSISVQKLREEYAPTVLMTGSREGAIPTSEDGSLVFAISQKSQPADAQEKSEEIPAQEKQESSEHIHINEERSETSNPQNMNFETNSIISTEKTLRNFVNNVISEYFTESDILNYSGVEYLCDRVMDRLESRLKTESRLIGR